MGSMFSRSPETYTTVKNKSSAILKTRIREVNSSAWDGDDRPDINLHDVTVGPGQHLTRRENINTDASASIYKLDLILDDESVITCTIDQGDASPGGPSVRVSSPLRGSQLTETSSGRNYPLCFSKPLEGGQGGKKRYMADVEVNGNTIEITITDVRARN